MESTHGIGDVLASPAVPHSNTSRRTSNSTGAVLLALGCVGFFGSCGPRDTPTPGQDTPAPGQEVAIEAAVADVGPWFVDAAVDLGLDFTHFNGRAGDLLLAEITCGAGALLDFDNDGDLDAYLLQGHLLGDGTLDDALDRPHHPPPFTDHLYRNDLVERGVLGFTPISVEASAEGLPDTGDGYGCGVATGDVNHDGHVDLYVANLGPDRLLLGRGDGTFEDGTETAGLGLDPAFGQQSGVTALFFDADRDGWLDLFVGNNVRFDIYGGGPRTRCESLSGAPDYCGPGAYPAQPDRLYRNLGPGVDGRVRFQDVTASAGLGASPSRPTLGAVAADFDGNGWPDLYVANDGEPNTLWLNRGPGDDWLRFEDEALLAGAAVNGSGAAEASMGVDVADVDDDGDLDLFLAHLVKESNTLYLNDGRAAFRDATAGLGLAAPSLPYTSFGSAFLDADNDGRLDLLVVNGAVTLLPSLVAAGDPFPLHQANQLFRQTADGTFHDATEEAGTALARSEVSRGLAVGDVDNDGDPDALVINNGGPARLWLNGRGQAQPWIGLRLLEGPGESPRRDALGSMAALLVDGRPTRWRRASSDGSYGSARDPRILFGLGDGVDPEGVRVRWSDGVDEDFPIDAFPLGRYTEIHRGPSTSIVLGPPVPVGSESPVEDPGSQL